MKEFKLELLAKIKVDGDKQTVLKKVRFDNYNDKCIEFVNDIKDIISKIENIDYK